MLNTSQQLEAVHSIRLLVIDDHAMFRSGLRTLFEKQHDMELVGESGNGESGVSLTMELQPDILFLDVALSRMVGMDVLRQLSERGASVKTILLTESIGRKHMIEAIQLGARGVVLKEATADLLFKAVRTVMAGEYWIDRGSVTDLAHELYNMMRERAGKNAFGMTPREREIVGAVLSGYSNKDIAEKLSISNQTVKNHLTAIFDKVGVSTRLELALCATKYRLDEQPL